jgi:AcrR family transcriptional regulator
MHAQHPTNVRRREIGAERRERTRQKLVMAAARVVAEPGENKANIDDFIKAAGVARGTFYNYYSTRELLLADLWARVGRNPLLEIQHACRTPSNRINPLFLKRSGSRYPCWGAKQVDTLRYIGNHARRVARLARGLRELRAGLQFEFLSAPGHQSRCCLSGHHGQHDQLLEWNRAA